MLIGVDLREVHLRLQLARLRRRRRPLRLERLAVAAPRRRRTRRWCTLGRSRMRQNLSRRARRPTSPSASRRRRHWRQAQRGRRGAYCGGWTSASACVGVGVGVASASRTVVTCSRSSCDTSRHPCILRHGRRPTADARAEADRSIRASTLCRADARGRLRRRRGTSCTLAAFLWRTLVSQQRHAGQWRAWAAS